MGLHLNDDLREDQKISRHDRQNRNLQSRRPTEKSSEWSVFQQPPPPRSSKTITQPINDTSNLLRRTTHSPTPKSDPNDSNPQQDPPHDERVCHRNIVHFVHTIKVLASGQVRLAGQHFVSVTPMVDHVAILRHLHGAVAGVESRHIGPANV